MLACMGVPVSKFKRFLTRSSDMCQCGHYSLVPKLAYLHNELGMRRATIASVCMVHSRLLDYSLRHTIMKRVAFFKAYLDVDGHELGRIVAKHPRLLWVRFGRALFWQFGLRDSLMRGRG